MVIRTSTTVIVLAILATTVVTSLSNTNIIRETNTAKKTSDIANKKQAAMVLLEAEQTLVHL